MTREARTWWGARFLEALELFTDRGRLARGRAYAGSGRILAHDIEGGRVTATVRGNANPYYDVYEEPRYTVVVRLAPLSAEDWARAIAYIAARAGFVSRLLMNDMPEGIDAALGDAGLSLLPRDHRDFATSCSCPDWANPCKHVAGVCYLLASLLDADPFLLFELRGLNRETLRAELARQPLGAILSEDLGNRLVEITPASSYYTDPATVPAEAPGSARAFWAGERRPVPPATLAGGGVPALVVKKGGDSPAFWPKDLSFIAVMEELYARIRARHRDLR